MLCIHVTFSLMLTFSLSVSYHEAPQSSLNLTPYIGRNVVCGRRPALIRMVMSSSELRC